jgi:glutamate--cysteine ligase catalytic subunit
MADENMTRAHYRDALLNQKFWFKTNCLSDLENYHTNTLAESDYLKSGNNNNDKK